MARGTTKRSAGFAGGGKGQGQARGRAGQARGKMGGSGRAGGSGKPRGPRREEGQRGDLIEGRRAVEEALICGIPLKSAFIADSSDHDGALDRIEQRLIKAGVPIEYVPRPRLDALSSHGAHQGVVARTKPFEYASLNQIIRRAGDGDALIVVLDHVTDQGNFGAMVRTAEVVGAAGVVVAKARSASVGVGAHKTSAGALMHLPVAQVPNLARALRELQDAGFWACAASEHAEQDVWHTKLPRRMALVMGSEGSGVSRLVADTCDVALRLPQRGKVESLNVAQANAVLCYEWLRCCSTEEPSGA